MREINKAIIHCSDSTWGDSEVINYWHVIDKGFDEIGYHYVILNGHRFGKKYRPEDNGLIETGRNIEVIGAHCKGYNTGSIGICLIGKHHFSQKQLESFSGLIAELRIKHNITSADVFGHYEFSDEKTCPNMTSEFLRRL
jgi:hypothetical protein